MNELVERVFKTSTLFWNHIRIFFSKLRFRISQLLKALKEIFEMPIKHLKINIHKIFQQQITVKYLFVRTCSSRITFSVICSCVQIIKLIISSKKLSSSGPGPSPISISKVKTQKRTRADVIIQLHHQPPTPKLFNVNIEA